MKARQGLSVACLEEIAWRNGWIGRDALEERGRAFAKNAYGQYLLSLAAQA